MELFPGFHKCVSGLIVVEHQNHLTGVHTVCDRRFRSNSVYFSLTNYVTIVSSFLPSMFSFHGQKIGCCIESYPVHVRAIDAAVHSFFNLVDSLLLLFKRFVQLKEAIINFGYCSVRYSAKQSCEYVPTRMPQCHKRFNSFGSVSQYGRALNPT